MNEPPSRSGDWRARAATVFTCEKRPASGAGGMVVTNHPLGTAAGAEMLAAGGNAVDAAVAALFTLSVVEPMMVGIFGGGMAHIRLADGRHTVIDGLATVPAAAAPDLYTPITDAGPGTGADPLSVVGRENTVGPMATAIGGTLKGWCDAHARHGTLPLQAVMASAIQHAAAGFTVTPYLADCIAECAADLVGDAEIARLFLPDGDPIPAGARLVQGDYAATLRTIARDGPDSLYGGAVGRAIADHMARAGGLITLDDLRAYRTVEREPVRGTYRGFEIVGPPPPSSGGVHVIQMLNILEGFDIATLGFGSAEASHLIAECLKIAFADRAVATADPDFVDVPVARLIDKAYAAERRGQLDRTRAQSWTAGVAESVALPESPNTTHVTVVDADRAIVTSTQTINSLFGARYVIAGTGMIANNYMSLFDPNPGRVQSIAPGKRTTTSQAPIIALASGRPVYALGLPGGLRIFGVAMQAVMNLIDHGMSLQEAVEAPRLWTQGRTVEIEDGFPAAVCDGLAALGHEVVPVAHVGGGMTAVRLDQDGLIHGAACWRADGMAMAIGGGPARTGARFWPDQAVPPSKNSVG